MSPNSFSHLKLFRFHFTPDHPNRNFAYDELHMDIPTDTRSFSITRTTYLIIQYCPM